MSTWCFEWMPNLNRNLVGNNSNQYSRYNEVWTTWLNQSQQTSMIVSIWCETQPCKCQHSTSVRGLIKSFLNVFQFTLSHDFNYLPLEEASSGIPVSRAIYFVAVNLTEEFSNRFFDVKLLTMRNRYLLLLMVFFNCRFVPDSDITCKWYSLFDDRIVISYLIIGITQRCA